MKITMVLIINLVILGSILPASAAGPGYGAGNGGLHLALPEPDNYILSATETADLLYMREEEQMAHDLYLEWAGMYSLPIFGNIAQAEETHAGSVQVLLDRYNLSSERIGNLSTGYENPVIQATSIVLAEEGGQSLADALNVAVRIEKNDITDLDMVIANTTRKDLKIVYENLRAGSENHLEAFSRILSSGLN